MLPYQPTPTPTEAAQQGLDLSGYTPVAALIAAVLTVTGTLIVARLANGRDKREREAIKGELEVIDRLKPSDRRILLTGLVEERINRYTERELHRQQQPGAYWVVVVSIVGFLTSIVLAIVDLTVGTSPDRQLLNGPFGFDLSLLLLPVLALSSLRIVRIGRMKLRYFIRGDAWLAEARESRKEEHGQIERFLLTIWSPLPTEEFVKDVAAEKAGEARPTSRPRLTPKKRQKASRAPEEASGDDPAADQP